ncbi:MAG: hypothetical protein AB1611_18210 [bacterium]
MKFYRRLSVIVLLFVFVFGVTRAFALQSRKAGQSPANTAGKASLWQINQAAPARQVSQPRLTSTLPQANFPSRQQPPFGKRQGGGAGHADVCTDGTYLYAVQGPLIHQYAILDLSLVKSIELPQTAVSSDTENSTATLPPPPGPGPSAVCTDVSYLYVLQGSLMHQYALPDMAFIKTVELPQPEVAADTEDTTPILPPPPGPRPSSICTNGSFLSVVQGHMVLQYTLPDFTLVKTVELPVPESLSTAGQE